MAIVLLLLVATGAAAAYGLASLFLLWPGYSLLWAIIVVSLIAAVVAHYGTGQRVLLRAADARLVRPKDAPELTSLIERVAGLADIPPPRLAVSTAAVPKAFALGWPA